MSSNAGAIRAGRAYVELFADKSSFVRTLRSAEKDLKSYGANVLKIGSAIAGIGVSILAGLAPAVLMFASAGDQLDKMSKRTGASVEALSALDYAAQRSGASLEDVEKSIKKTQDNMLKATLGSAEAAQGFTLLGLSVGQLANMKPEDQFLLIGDRLSKIKNPAARAAMAIKVFGEAGTKLLPMFEGGAKGVGELMKKAEGLGLVMSTKDATAAAQLKDALDDVTSTIGGLYKNIGAALAPLLTDLAITISNVVATASKWVSQNRPLIVSIAKIAAVVVAVGTAIATIGVAIIGAGAVLGGLATVLTTIGAVIGGLISAFGLLLTPIGASIALLVAAVGAWAYFSGAAGDAIGFITDAFWGLLDDATAAWGGIADALAAGDLEAAAKIAWLTVQLEVQKVVNWISERWHAFTNEFLNMWDGATGFLASLFVDGFAAIETAWVHTTDFLADAWDVATTGFMSSWKTAQNFIAKGFGWLIAKLEGIDPAQVMNELDAELSRTQQSDTASRDQRVGERDAARRDRLAQIKSDRQALQASIEDDQARKARKRQAGYDSAVAQSEAALAAARDEWSNAIGSAADKRSALENGRTAGKVKSPSGAEFDFSSAKQSTAGTFRSAAVGSLAGSGVWNTIADATKETAINTKRLAEKQAMRYGS